jgi:hypothetical protein
MALSPNYGWAEPDNSSLVKNGAQDIRALGDAIDTSLWNVGFGQAGKNKILNGDFGIWQRGTSFSNPNNVYSSDRWLISRDGTPTTWTVSQQNHTAGQALSNSQYFMRSLFTTAGTTTIAEFTQKIEDVRTFAGQTVTFSLLAAADANRDIEVYFYQDFGSGGSAGVLVSSQVISVTSTLARYNKTFAIPSITGKTIGTGSSLYAIIQQKGVVNGARLDIGDVMVEYGSKATPFETATGTIQGELAACQRYYYRIQNDSTNAYTNITGIAYSATGIAAFVPLKTTMRVTPTAVDFASLRSFDATNTATITAITLSAASPNVAALDVTASSLTQYRPYVILGNTVPSFIGFSAEL